MLAIRIGMIRNVFVKQCTLAECPFLGLLERLKTVDSIGRV